MLTLLWIPSTVSLVFVSKNKFTKYLGFSIVWPAWAYGVGKFTRNTLWTHFTSAESSQIIFWLSYYLLIVIKLNCIQKPKNWIEESSSQIASKTNPKDQETLYLYLKPSLGNNWRGSAAQSLLIVIIPEVFVPK